MHSNIPVFVPHVGCPNDCVFCNQRVISGTQNFELSAVRRIIEVRLATLPPDATCEIAFFGGSFTGIERGLMTSLLQTAAEYRASDGRIIGIRLSTRPDYISPEIIEILRSYDVTTVEIGVQSMSDKVLSACKRGHSAADTVRAAALIKSAGMSFVGQMMIGLPRSNFRREVKTAREIVRLGADAVRVYPTAVLRDTALADRWRSGKYKPPTLDASVKRAGLLLEYFDSADIPCIRCGLAASEELSSEGAVVAGIYHPAFGEMAAAYAFKRRQIQAFRRQKKLRRANITVLVPPKCTSKASGQHASNKEFLLKKYRLRSVKIKEDPTLTGFEVKTIRNL